MRALPALYIAAFSLAIGGCSHAARTTTPSRSAPPVTAAPVPSQPTPTASPVPVTPPVITPTPGPSATSSPAAPRIAKKVPRVAPDAAPQILAIAISETTVQPGDHVSGSVVTSSNVASVEARIGGYAVSLSKVGVGRFALTYTVGALPWFVRGNFTMQVIARNTRGDAVTRAIPLTVR